MPSTSSTTRAIIPRDSGARGAPPRPRMPSLHLRTATLTGAFDDPGHNLRVACLIWVGLWSFGLFMNNLVSPLASPGQPLDDAWPFPANPIAYGCIGVSLALYAASRWGRLSSSRLVDLALLYEIVVALGIGIVNQWTPNTEGLSWVVVVILLHPLIVAAPIAKAFAAALVAASMDFVGLAIAGARGVDLPTFPVMIWTYLPNFVAAILAILPARVRVRMDEHRTTARELGSYQVGELLSRGGMGEIYRAEHRMLVRPAALKIIRPEALGRMDNDGRHRIVQRFQREAKVTAGLRSPHTVAVYDFGVAPNGTLYYVMELLDGLNLEALVQRHGPVPPERAVHILLQVCDSLGEAHELGLIHRDIKPSNVMLSHYGSHVDFVKVLDFGLARRADVVAGDLQLTGEATVLGTPAFMAPEQISGSAPVDPRTDLYAVGCLAYWLVTGQHVFDCERPVEALVHHLNTPPVPASTRTELSIPDELDRVILACLEKDLQRRPPSAAALANLLLAVPAPPWTEEQARRWWDLHLASALDLTPRLST